jgi:hypothetical protein
MNKNFYTSLCHLLTASLLLGLAMVCRAEDPCAGDRAKFCGAAAGGTHPHVMSCLFSHKAELSPACQERVATLKKAAEMASKDCAVDTAKFCKGLKFGQGLAKCLRKHNSKLTAACQGHFAGRANAASAGKPASD